MESINNTQISLKFEMSEEDKLMRIKYLQARYKDIAECNAMDVNIQNNAYRIYVAIQETLDKLE